MPEHVAQLGLDGRVPPRQRAAVAERAGGEQQVLAGRVHRRALVRVRRRGSARGRRARRPGTLEVVDEVLHRGLHPRAAAEPSSGSPSRSRSALLGDPAGAERLGRAAAAPARPPGRREHDEAERLAVRARRGALRRTRGSRRGRRRGSVVGVAADARVVASPSSSPSVAIVAPRSSSTP